MENSGNRDRLYLEGLQNHCRWWLQSWNSKTLTAWKKVMTKLDSLLKSRDITLLTKVHLSQSYGFSSGHVWMWELDYKESWATKNWCFWTVILEKTLENPLDSKEIKAVNPKGNQSWIFIGRTDAETEAPILWPPDVKSWLFGKDLDAGKDWKQEEKGTTEDEMVGCITDSMDMSLSKAWEMVKRGTTCCSPWVTKSRTGWLSD